MLRELCSAACLRVQLLLGQLDVGGGALAKCVQHARVLLHKAAQVTEERREGCGRGSGTIHGGAPTELSGGGMLLPPQGETTLVTE